MKPKPPKDWPDFHPTVANLLGDFELSEGAAKGSGILGAVALAGVGLFIGGDAGLWLFLGGAVAAGVGIFRATNDGV